MPIEIVVPRLGWSMDEGTFVGWLKVPGESVAAGEMLFQLEGEKATEDIETFDSGVLCVPEDAPQPGDVVAVGQVLGFLVDAGEEAPSCIGKARNRQASAVPAEPISPPARDTTVAAGRQNAGPNIKPNRVIATPRARRAAREAGISVGQLRGTGRNGRIRERDVLAVGASPVSSRLRQTIAARMMAGAHQTAPVTLTRKTRADQLVKLRAELKQQPRAGISPTVNELLLQLVCRAIGQHPLLNGHWYEDSLRMSEPVHLAFGVDTPAGLLAPVIRHAHQLTLDQIAVAARELVEKTRSGSLSNPELTGGTFTVTNLGSLGIDTFTPILNVPQVAILGIGRLIQEPVVQDGQLAVGWTIQLCLTFDHRAIDGADGARFLQTLSEMIEPSS